MTNGLKNVFEWECVLISFKHGSVILFPSQFYIRGEIWSSIPIRGTKPHQMTVALLDFSNGEKGGTTFCRRGTPTWKTKRLRSRSASEKRSPVSVGSRGPSQGHRWGPGQRSMTGSRGRCLRSLWDIYKIWPLKKEACNYLHIVYMMHTIQTAKLTV